MEKHCSLTSLQESDNDAEHGVREGRAKSGAPLNFTLGFKMAAGLSKVISEQNGAFFVKAKFHLFGATETERPCSKLSGYSPNHNFGGPDNRSMFIGKMTFQGVDAVAPGETIEVIVRFIPNSELEKFLTAGRTWRIQEGPHLVGEATLVEVVNET